MPNWAKNELKSEKLNDFNFLTLIVNSSLTGKSFWGLIKFRFRKLDEMIAVFDR